MTIDNGNHLLLSGNRAALDYLRSIGAEHRLIGPATAEFSFVDLASGERWTLRFNDGPVPFWIFDPRRRVPGTRPLDYLPLARLLWAPAGKTVGEVIACKGTLYRAVGRAAAARGAEYRCAAGSRAACGRDRSRNACRRRPRLPAADRARRIGRDADRAGAGVCCSSAAPTVRFEHQLRAIRFAGERVEALDFGGETIALDAGDAVVLAVPPYAAASLVRRPRRADRIPRHRQRAFPHRAAGELPPILGVLNATVQWIFAFPGRRLRHHQRRRSAHRHAARRIGENDLERGRARDRTCRPRCRPGRSCASGARRSPPRRRRTPNGPARQRNGAIWCSPAIGQIPACPLPSKARSDPAIAPPT